MKELILNLLKSKRVWVVALAVGILAIKQYAGVDPCAGVSEFPSDGSIFSGAGILVILTKIWDSAKNGG